MKKKIAVIIPCYNEELTIGKVVKDFKEKLPSADIYVCDNNSTDNSVEIAKNCGSIIRYEKKQGKGNVIKSMFKIIDADCYLIVDGDNTYSPEAAKEMCDLVLKNNYDMVIGDRLSSTYYEENKRLFHNFGNKIVCNLVKLLFKFDIKDVLTGYRALSYNFVKNYPVLSKKFEIETEMTIYAIYHNYKIKVIPTGYKDRIEGSYSKLHTYKDGIIIIKKFKELIKEYHPRLLLNIYSLISLAISLLIGLPILIEYLKLKAISNILSLIVSIIFLIISIILYIIGIILEILFIKYDRLYELYLNKSERRD